MLQSLLPMGETQDEFLTLDFRITQSQLLEPSEESISREKILFLSLFLPLSLSLCDPLSLLLICLSNTSLKIKVRCQDRDLEGLPWAESGH